ncbi:MAG: DNA mismatch repair endonuclease MutL [Ignavibacteriales bacterium]|nr:DNA mismatch repair endonuclease MutL [Ignavibacteriales bacterium]
MQPELANRIAAGEVVQRPSSAVKELVENSLDAGAPKITVIVKDAGRSLIQVVDNGDGMAEDDALLAFRRHATSKISSAQDLENIRTLGFRGEALASISAVAQVELKTRIAADDVGTLLRIEGDTVKEHSKTALERGTTIIVRNLFYNTPARRQFLKTDHTELKSITDVVTRMAIAYPEVEWLYTSNDEVLLDLRKKSMEGRVADVFGERQFESLIRFNEKTEFMSVEGFICKPDFARKSRVDQFLYLNRRSIVSRMIQHAVFQAYEHLLEKGSFPFFILNLTIDPRKVDVNVHPSKLEVKFENESNVYRFVLSVVRRVLAEHDLFPAVAFTSGEATSRRDEPLRFERGNIPMTESQDVSGSAGSILSATALESATAVDIDELFARKREDIARTPIFPTRDDPTEAKSRVLQHVTQTSPMDSSQQGRAIWQTHNKYILSQIRTGLMIVDQHAAHERILYERAVANFENNLPFTQQLLFPQTVELSASDYGLAKELQPYFEKLGFAMKLFGKNTLVIEGIPADVRVGSEQRILQDVLDGYKNNEYNSTMDARDNLAKSFSCKAAIKAGDRLNTAEMISLIDHLFATQIPYVCPHGRPVVVKISIEELDRRFGRTS